MRFTAVIGEQLVNRTEEENMAVLYGRDCYSSNPAQYGTESSTDCDTCNRGTTEKVAQVNVENIVERRQNINDDEIILETEWTSLRTCLEVSNSRRHSNHTMTGEITLGDSRGDQEETNQPKEAGRVLLARTMRAIRLRMRRRKGAKARAILESHF